MQRCLMLGVLLAVACGAGAVAEPTAPKAVQVAPVTAPAPPPAIAAPTVTPEHADQQAAAPEIEARLRAHFAKYQGGAAFGFFEQDFAPRVERYLALKDVTATELAKDAARFYASKSQVSLVPKAGTAIVTNEGERVVASFTMTMSWSEKPPAGAAACGFLDESMTWRPHSLVKRSVEVVARVGFDGAGRIVSYEEVSVVRPRLRVATRGDDLQVFVDLPTEPARMIESAPSAARVPDGTIVEDWGETFTCGLNQTEVDTVRRVRFNGRVIWLLADWTYDTGHNFVGETLLVNAP